MGCEGSLERVEPAPEEPGIGGAGIGIPPEQEVPVLPPPEDIEIADAPEVAEDALTGTVRGEVTLEGPETLVVTDAQGRKFWLELEMVSQIHYRGEPSSALIFKPGAIADVSFVTDALGDQVVVRANVLQVPERR